MTVAGAPAEKASRLVAAEEALRIAGEGPRFVGRGGEKLDAALHHFRVDVSGRPALDAGASTGGFTDCLLQAGATRVVAVDVGRGQLHERLRSDQRVTVLDRTNVRRLTPGRLGGERFPVVTADLSFISLRTVAPSLVGLAAPDGDLIVLVKPQFEAGRAEVGRGRGVIRDPEVWEKAVADVAAAFAAEGSDMMGTMRSPLTGADGNVEFLMHLRAPGDSY